jgi:hypothetical protein
MHYHTTSTQMRQSVFLYMPLPAMARLPDVHTMPTQQSRQVGMPAYVQYDGCQSTKRLVRATSGSANTDKLRATQLKKAWVREQMLLRTCSSARTKKTLI